MEEDLESLDIQIELNGKQTPFTYSMLHISKEMEQAEVVIRSPNDKPYLNRFRPYSLSYLESLTYKELVQFFFDKIIFRKDIYYEKEPAIKQTEDDTVLRQNIYMTLYFLFPTGFPTTRNIRFSCDIISGQKESHVEITESMFKNLIRPKKPMTNANGNANTNGNGNANGMRGGAAAAGAAAGPGTGTTGTEEPKRKRGYFQPWDRRFSYLKIGSDVHTITQVTWKNDLYNNVDYARLLTQTYNYCSNMQRLTSSAYNQTAGTGAKMNKLDEQFNQAEGKLKVKMESPLFKTDIKPGTNITKIKAELENIKKATDEVSKDAYRKNIKDIYDQSNFITYIQTEFSDVIKGTANYISQSTLSLISTLQADVIQLLSSFVFLYNMKEAIHNKKMVDTVTYHHNGNDEYAKAMGNIKIAPFIKPFSDELNKFTMKQNTNPRIEQMVNDYRNSKNNTLAYHAIYFRGHLLNDRTGKFDDLSTIVTAVKQIHKQGWKNIYTGILVPKVTDFVANSSDTSSSGNKRVFTIYLSMNLFDQELNNDTAYLFKCFLLNNELGNRLDRLMSSSKPRSNILFESEIKHVPKMGNKNLTEAAKAVDDDEKKKAAEEAKKKAEEEAKKKPVGGQKRYTRRNRKGRKRKVTRRRL